MLPLPTPTDEINLADWMELCALVSQDTNFSLGDAERVLRQSATIVDARIEEVLAEISYELRYRETAAADAYAFEFSGTSIQLKAEPERYYHYIFCLCLSYFAWEADPEHNVFPARMFEQLSCLVAKSFVGGEAIRFAAPREGPVPTAFRDAVDYLCRHIGEGEGMLDIDESVGQDDTLDVVAWRDFPDRAAGKLLLFGQCAAGRNWRSKISDLQPRDFSDKYMQQAPSSNLLKALFIPHRIVDRQWRKRTVEAKLIFDRCRIAYWAHRGAGNGNAFTHWYTQVLEGTKDDD